MVKKKWLSVLLSAAMLLGTPFTGSAVSPLVVKAAEVSQEASVRTEPVVMESEEAQELVNIAPQCTIEVEAEQTNQNNVKENMVDGKPATLWVKAGGGFPATAGFVLPEDAGKVKKVVAVFESGKINWSVDMALSVDGEQQDTRTGVKFTDGYTYEFTEAVEADKVVLTLNNPKNGESAGTFWPGLAEVEIWVEAPADSQEEETGANAGLSEVASRSVVTVPSKPEDASKLTDGDPNSRWTASGGNWPSQIDFALPGNLLVKKVEIDFEKVAGRTMQVQLSKAVNNVVSDYADISTSPQTHALDQTYVYELEDAERMTHLRITLSAPSPNTLWPCVGEVRIYAVNEELSLDEYENISAHAEISSVGGSHNQDQRERLTDGSYGEAYEYSSSSFAQITSEDGAWVNFDFDSNQQVAGFEVAFPEGSDGTEYTYDILGKTKRDSGWTTYVSQATVSGGEGGWKNEHVLDYVTGMSQVRVRVTGCSDTALKPALTEVKIYGEYTEAASDADSIAWEKPVHSNFNAGSAYLINDGNDDTAWTGTMYPAYVDIDLQKNYNLSEISVVTPAAGYSQYGVYASLDGRDFVLVGEKQDKAACAAGGDKFETDQEARIVRIYLEYYSQSTQPKLCEVRIKGTPSGSAVQTAPALNIEDFEGSEYDVEITDALAIEEVKNIIRRNVGEGYEDWFTFALAPHADGYDYFTLEDADGKIKITGNNGVSLATGVNHYLKYFCHVLISQVGSQVDMPDEVVPVGETVHKETEFPVRYAYNYCTHSYSMSFWGREEWQKEIDWLALNGVNLVLDITGQEEVWRRFLVELGYSHQEAKDFLAGPAYYAWAYMANLTGFGGPVHDTWLEERVELARENHLTMRKLGMDVVLQAYSGMVPVGVETMDPSVAGNVIAQGKWCSFRRPDMLKTSTEAYDRYAEIFYRVQEEVFGATTNFYATDPFHEGGNKGGMSEVTVASEILNSLLTYDEDGVWVIQSWQGNPTNDLLAGLREGTDRRDHALVLDLYAEKTQNWKSYGVDTDGDGLKEFSDTPWVFCQLNNFGGRMGLHGHLDNVAANIPAAANQSRHMKGIGITPEASQNNPMLYDFLFETIWVEDASVNMEAIDVDQWVKEYAIRRYGAENANAMEAAEILVNTVYKASLNMIKQGAPESVINARPNTSISAASTWGNAIISYDKRELERAAELLLEEYDTLSGSDGYLYDLADILKQILSNTAQEVHSAMAAAYSAGNLEEFTAQSDRFLALIDLNEKVLGTREEFLFGTWTTNATELAANADEFTENLYLFNAKALVTTWGSYDQCESGQLKDYSNRQWAGLTNDFYKARWQIWIDNCKTKLTTGSQPSMNWFEWEWAYARDNKTYSNVKNNESLKELGEQILADFRVPPPGPEANDENDIDRTTIRATAGTFQSGEGADRVLDNNSDTLWHSNYTVAPLADRWIQLDLGSVKKVNGLRYLPRQSAENGIITSYRVDVSENGSDWEDVDTGTWAKDAKWKGSFFDPVDARYIRLYALASASNHVSAAEIRITQPAPEVVPVDKAGLQAAIEAARSRKTDGKSYTQESLAALDTALAAAEALLGDSDTTQEAVDTAAAELQSKITALTEVSGTEEPVDPVVPDRTALEAAVAAAEEKLNDGKTYEEAGVTALEAALAEAETLLADEEASQEDLDALAAELQELTAALTEQASTPEKTEKPWIFTDVSDKDKSHWMYKAVHYVYNTTGKEGGSSLMADTGGSKKFEPERPLDRAMLATILHRWAGEPAGNYPNKFTDVKSGYYVTAVLWANSKGIVNGKGGSSVYAPTDNVTRAEIAKMLYLYGTNHLGLTLPNSGDLSKFADANVVAGKWSEPFLKWATSVGIIGGVTRDGKFYLDPNEKASRAQCAAMIQRFGDKYVK